MSELTDFRDGFNAYVSEAHGTPKKLGAADSVLPPGHSWVPHVPRTIPMPDRLRRPASGPLADIFDR